MWSATTSAASAGTTKEHVILRPWHWAQHAADDRKGLLYYPVDGAIQVQDSASLEKCSTGATGLPWSNQVDSSISCAPSIYPRSQPFHHFHRVIGFDIIIRDLLHLFPGVSLMASLLFGITSVWHACSDTDPILSRKRKRITHHQGLMHSKTL